MQKATKPLKPKKIYSLFCVKTFVENGFKKKYLIFGQNNVIEIYANSQKEAKRIFRTEHTKEKILTVKLK